MWVSRIRDFDVSIKLVPLNQSNYYLILALPITAGNVILKDEADHTGRRYSALLARADMLGIPREARLSFRRGAGKQRTRMKVRIDNEAVQEKLSLRAALKTRVLNL